MSHIFNLCIGTIPSSVELQLFRVNSKSTASLLLRRSTSLEIAGLEYGGPSHCFHQGGATMASSVAVSTMETAKATCTDPFCNHNVRAHEGRIVSVDGASFWTLGNAIL